MKHRMFLGMASLCLAWMTIVSCQKEDAESGLTLDATEMNRAGRSGPACKVTSYELVFDAGGIYQLDTYTYRNGRLYDWFVSYGGFYRMVYNQKGRLIQSNYYFDDVLVNEIKFEYENDRVVKEIWLDGATGDWVDEVTNIYNHKGQIIESRSIAFDYIVKYVLDPQGNALSWTFYTSGQLVQKGEYTYKHNVRSPLATTTGLPYEFGYANGALFASPNWYSSERITNYDENGATVVYDLDPKQSMYDLGKFNLPNLITYTDLLTQAPITNAFTFNACGDESNDRVSGRHPGTNRAGLTNSGKRLRY